MCVYPESSQIETEVIASGRFCAKLTRITLEPGLSEPESARLNDRYREMLLGNALVSLDHELLHLVDAGVGLSGRIEPIKNGVVNMGEIARKTVHIPLQHFNRSIDISQSSRTGTVGQRILFLSYYNV